jgi:hypothetical protein
VSSPSPNALTAERNRSGGGTEEEQRLRDMPLCTDFLGGCQRRASPPRGRAGTTGEKLSLAPDPSKPDGHPPSPASHGDGTSKRPVDGGEVAEPDGVGRQADQKVRAQFGGSCAAKGRRFEAPGFAVTAGLAKDRAQGRRRARVGFRIARDLEHAASGALGTTEFTGRGEEVCPQPSRFGRRSPGRIERARRCA